MSLDSISEEQAESILDRLARRVGHKSVGVSYGGTCLCLMDNLQALPTILVVKDGLETVPYKLLWSPSMDGSPRLSSLSILENILDISKAGLSIGFFAPPSQEQQKNWRMVEFLPAGMTLEKLLIALDLEEVA